jgi:Protein of unknown function (DUF3309)
MLNVLLHEYACLAARGGASEFFAFYPGVRSTSTEFALTVTTIWNGVKYMYTILLIILVLLLIGALPTWPYSTAWGYYPSGGLGLVLIIVLVLVLMGRV